MERYILKYLYDHSNNPKEKRFLDYFKIPLDQRIYAFGMHHSCNFELEQKVYKDNILQDNQKRDWHLHPRRAYRNLKTKIRSLLTRPQEKKECTEPINEREYRYKVLSTFVIPKSTIEAFNKVGIGVYHYGTPAYPGEAQYISRSLIELDKFRKEIHYKDFNELLTNENYEVLDRIYNEAVEEFKESDFDAVLVLSSELVEAKFIIDVFKAIGRPSITLLHGLPGIYIKETESRADHLCVWGEEIRNNFLSVGYQSANVHVAGNYKYISVSSNSQLRCALEDVLILTTEPFVMHQHQWDWRTFPSQDRSILITYLYNVENVLKKHGVNHARLRPHPGVSKQWLAKFVDMSFYAIDNEDLDISLSRAAMCIGQTSSTMLEAINCGVSYLIYEPTDDGVHAMNGDVLVPPFNGSEPGVKIAQTEEQLDEMISDCYKPDPSFLERWMKSFDANVILNILKHTK